MPSTAVPMLTVTEDDVRRVLPMDVAIRLMRRAFEGLASGAARNQPRRRLALPGGTVLHSMAATYGKYLGTKVYSTNVKHDAHFFFLLFAAETGRPLAMFEANYLGQIRTGAASGYVTSLMAPPGADTAGLIGSGFQAESQLEAVLQVRPIRRVRVWSRRAENRLRFAQCCSARFGIAVEAARSAREAVEGAAIVTTATSSKEPVLEADWIAPGAHVNAVGSNNPSRRELPPELILRAGLIAVDSLEQARIESGDLLLAVPPEHWKGLPLVEVADLVTRAREQENPGAVTIFKSNGLAVEDVVAAGFVYEQLTGQGDGGGGYS